MNKLDNNIINNTVCFYAREGQLILFTLIAQRLIERNIKCIFVTQNFQETIYIKNRIENAVVYEIEEYLETNWDVNIDIENLINDEIKKNYWRMIYTDRFLVNYNHNDCVKIVNLHIKLFSDIFFNEKIRFFVNEPVAIFSSYIALEIGRKFECEFISAIMARDNPQNEYFYFNDLFQRNMEMEYYYNNTEFTTTEMEYAKDYLERFREINPKPAYMNLQGKKPKITWKMPIYPIKYLMLRNKDCYTNKIKYMTYKRAFQDINSPLLNYIRYLISMKYYMNPIENEEYYLFPLHYQPEASTLVCAEKYEKQMVAIDHIAKSLPYGKLLYVKEHYAILGHREINFYKELKKYPNVRLISPYENIHSLIRNSLACIVLTNTTGFEAILHGKKVFVLGNVFYDFFNNVERISDIYLENHKLQHYTPECGDDAIIRFICAYKRSLYNGCVYPLFDRFIEKDNVDKLIDNYEEHLAKKIKYGF